MGSMFLTQNLSTCSFRALSTGAVVVVHGFSCSKACGIFPDEGSNPCGLLCQVDPFPLSNQGSPMGSISTRFFNFHCMYRITQRTKTKCNKQTECQKYLHKISIPVLAYQALIYVLPRWGIKPMWPSLPSGSFPTEQSGKSDGKHFYKVFQLSLHV